MTLRLPYRFAIAICAEDGASLGTVAAKHDWEPEFEWTRFHYQRRGELALDDNGGASILPHWNSSLGEPYCQGFSVEIERAGTTPVAFDFPITHFRDFAKTASSVFVEKKMLREGELFTYALVAYPAPSEEPGPNGLQVTNASPRIPAKSASLDSYARNGRPHGAIDAADMPVFVAPQVLAEAAAQTRAREGTETGGILIGSLWHDERAGEIFAEVTAQIPAEHTTGTNLKLTFTPQTWAAADAALRLRGRDEVYLGYWHSHPVRAWCKSKECTLESQKSCPFARDFFSADDISVMRAAFPRAYSVAIVANDTAFTDLTFSMFGNREGLIKPRGFYVLEESNHGA